MPGRFCVGCLSVLATWQLAALRMSYEENEKERGRERETGGVVEGEKLKREVEIFDNLMLSIAFLLCSIH